MGWHKTLCFKYAIGRDFVFPKQKHGKKKKIPMEESLLIYVVVPWNTRTMARGSWWSVGDLLGGESACEQYCNKKYRPAGLFPVHVWRYNADMKPDFVKGFRILHLGRRNAYDWVGRGDGGVLWEQYVLHLVMMGVVFGILVRWVYIMSFR